jgi:hypothetical protein
VASDKGPPFEAPKGQIEILPPEEDDRPIGGGFEYSSGFGRVKIVRLGPLSSLAVFAAICLAMALGLVFIGGALLFILPIAGLLAAGAALYGLFGNQFKRLR